jgi:hypothetical protein
LKLQNQPQYNKKREHMNRQLFASVITSFVLLDLLAASSFARFIEMWPYEKLVAESDLVAIVEPIENRAATDSFPYATKQSSTDFSATDTRFKVHATLKGGAKSLKELTVLHFTYSKEATIINGPSFILFPVEKRKVSTAFGPPERAQGKIYLAFLKRRPDGRLEPVRGQYDSVLSFRELREDLDIDLGK